MANPSVGRYRRCDNCQLQRESFVCIRCLQETVRKNRSRVVVAFNRAATCLDAVASVLDSKQSEEDAATPKRRFANISVLNFIRSRLTAEISHLESKANQLRSSCDSRRQRLNECQLPLHQAQSTLPSSEYVQRGYQDQRIAISRRELELRIERRRAIEILLEQCYRIRRVSSRSCSIVGCVLPDDCSDLHALVHSVQVDTAQSIVAALGYVVQVVDMIAVYMQVKLPYPLHFLGAESYIICEFGGRRSTYPLSLSSPNSVFQLGLEYLEKDLMVLCRDCGLSLLIVPRCSFLPNLLMLLEAVKLAPARSAPLPSPPSPIMPPEHDRDPHRDFVIIE